MFNIERCNPKDLSKSYEILGKYASSSYIKEHLNKWRTQQISVSWPLWNLVPKMIQIEQDREADKKDIKRLKMEQILNKLDSEEKDFLITEKFL